MLKTKRLLCITPVMHERRFWNQAYLNCKRLFVTIHVLNSLREWGERRSTRVFALKIAQKRLEFEGVCNDCLSGKQVIRHSYDGE